MSDARTPAPSARRQGDGLSLLARTGLTLLVTTVVMAVTAVVALDRLVVQPMAMRWAADEAGLFELAIRTWRQLPADARFEFEIELVERHDLVLTAESRELAPLLEVPTPWRLLRDDLSSRLGAPLQLRTGDELIWIEVPADGAVPALRVGFSPTRRASEPLGVAMIIVVVGAFVVLVGAFLIVQRVARALTRTAAAAAAFGRGRFIDTVPEEGPREIRALARSFNTMAREITSLIDQRTTFLAGVNHDLRTPLARMRVAVELLPEDADPTIVARISRNLEEMDELLSVALQYARGATLERAEPAILRGIVEPLLPDGAQLQWSGDADAVVSIAAGPLRRVLQNLIVNAERYGGDAPIEVAVDVLPERLRLAVRDRGPGIPVDRQIDVFQPFFRLEHGSGGVRISVPPRTGRGSGLGLAIVKQLCDTHGWAVQLRNRDGGGTEALVDVDLRNRPVP